MRYDLVFDAELTGFRYYWFPLVSLLLTLGFGGAIVARRVVSGSKRMGGPALIVVGAIGGTLTLIFFLAPYSQYLALRDALRANQFITVEGRVTHFSPQDSGLHQPEAFDVGGHHYEYSASVLLPGFNRTQPRGGPIREGLRVRIADVHGQIARLEIAR